MIVNPDVDILYQNSYSPRNTRKTRKKYWKL